MTRDLQQWWKPESGSVRGRLRWRCLTKREGILIKLNMMRNEDTFGRWIKTEIDTLCLRVYKENTRNGTRGEFVFGIRPKPGVTETSENIKFRVIR